ncbi:Hypothetical_protein [Hexamita inflata]|uniref:Hypothetical_protein n=1 Tax=Hexamita inflata TaxID=28002 RepID=A0AA86QKF4_9EUKA|nr:Hypothetical protein HINF_LOCUS48799 [Hexamita inflata]
MLHIHNLILKQQLTVLKQNPQMCYITDINYNNLNLDELLQTLLEQTAYMPDQQVIQLIYSNLQNLLTIAESADQCVFHDLLFLLSTIRTKSILLHSSSLYSILVNAVFDNVIFHPTAPYIRFLILNLDLLWFGNQYQIISELRHLNNPFLTESVLQKTIESNDPDLILELLNEINAQQYITELIEHLNYQQTIKIIIEQMRERKIQKLSENVKTTLEYFPEAFDVLQKEFNNSFQDEIFGLEVHKTKLLLAI